MPTIGPPAALIGHSSPCLPSLPSHVRNGRLAVDRPGVAVGAGAWSSASGSPGPSACSDPTRRPARRSGSGSPPGSWCWPPGGPRSGRAGGALHPGRGRVRRRDRPGPGPARAGGRRRARDDRGSDDERSLSQAASADRLSCAPRRRRLHRRGRPAVWIDDGAEPRDGVQPVEIDDEAFYAVLGRDLATTGTETNLQPRGSPTCRVSPAQTWYHWGELWLASAVIAIFGVAPLAARYFVVLPLLLLAAAALTGTLVRRVNGTAVPGGLPVRLRRLPASSRRSPSSPVRSSASGRSG